MKTRHTITLNHETFGELKKFGYFGESYSQLIQRLLKSVEGLPIGENI